MIVELRPTFDVHTTSPLELIRSGIETERLERIPLDRVLTEHALIDDFHADELGASMRQKRGQITPIAVRVSEVEGLIVYDVIDGFHRVEGKRRTGDTDINATVIYGCSDEEMYDLRILAASSVRSVQFPRIAQWIFSSYEITPFAEKGLTVAQAFSLVVNDSQRSNIVKLSKDEIAELKDWARKKCERWGKSVTAVYGILRVVSNADPDLVKQVRTSGGGKDHAGRITPARLTAVVDSFPGNVNHMAQRAILRVVVEKRLSAEETSYLAERLKGLINSRMDEELVYSIASGVTIERKVFSVRTHMQEDAGDEGYAVDWDEIEPDEEDLAAIEDGRDEEFDEEEIQVGKSVAPQDTPRAPAGNARYFPQRRYERDVGARSTTGAFARGEAHDPEQLQRQVIDLQEALERAHKALQEGGNGHIETWWRTAPYLSPIERTCVEEILYRNTDVDVVAERLKVTENYALLLIRSAFAKRSFNEPHRE